MTFFEKVEAKYQVIVKEQQPPQHEITAADLAKFKAFLKKAVVPALMTLGPVACGHPSDKPPKQVEVNVEQQVNKGMSDQHESLSDVKCDVQMNKDGSSTIVFTGKVKDSDGSVTMDKLVLEMDEGSGDRVVDVTVKTKPKTERMQWFQNQLNETMHEFGKSYTLDKYECVFKLPPTQPSIEIPISK